MAAIYEEALKKAVGADKSNLYLLFGEDAFLKQMYLNKIIGKVCDTDDVFNFQKFGADTKLQELYDFVLQLPLMSDRKCALLCDYDFEHCSKSELDMLCQLIDELPKSTVLVICFLDLEFDHKKSARFKKLIAAVEKNEGVAAILNHRRTPELVKMLCDGAAKRGCTLDSGVARYIVETVGEDINLLKNELDKLCAFCATASPTKETVDLVCVKSVEAEIYSLSKQIIACNTSAALATLDALFFERVEPVVILSTVSSAYVDMYRVFLCRKKGITNAEAAKLFDYKNKAFVLDRAADNLKRFDFSRLALSFEALTEADRVLKSSGTDAKATLQQLIIRLIYIIAKGVKVDKA